MQHIPYPKIRSVYWRDMDGEAKIIQGKYSKDYFEYLANLEWVGTEKLDGMNVGLVWDGHSISFQGRTEQTNFSKPQIEWLNETFNNHEVEEILEQQFGETPAVFYGELVGKGIQAYGAKYHPNSYRYVVFDIQANGVWYNRGAVEYFARAIGAEVTPVLIRGTLPDLVKFVRQKPADTMAYGLLQSEGLVARPKIELQDNKGERIITKIKVGDVCE